MKRLGKQAVTRAVDEAMAGQADLEYQTRITADRCTLAFAGAMDRKPVNLQGSPLFPEVEPEPQATLFGSDEGGGGIRSFPNPEGSLGSLGSSVAGADGHTQTLGQLRDERKALADQRNCCAGTTFHTSDCWRVRDAGAVGFIPPVADEVVTAAGNSMPVIASDAESVAWATWTVLHGGVGKAVEAHAIAILAAADTEVNRG